MAGSQGDAWRHRAPLYRLQQPLERPALRALASMLDVGESESVLDIATGTGALLRQLARAHVRPRSVVGVDRSSAMLARVPKLPPGWGLALQDAAALPFPDDCFDVVTASYLLHLLDPAERAAVIGEVKRVLAPGGRFGSITVAPPRRALSRMASSPLRALAERSNGAMAGLRPLDPRRELEQAGLHPVSARRVRLGYPSLCVVCERRVA